MRRTVTVFIVLVLVVGAFLLFPSLLTFTIQHGFESSQTTTTQFPVTVDPKNKIIVENAQVNALFENNQSPFRRRF